MYENYSEKFEGTFSQVDVEFNQKMIEINQLTDKINTISNEFNSSLISLQQKEEAVKEDINVILDNLSAEFHDKSNSFFMSNELKAEEIENKYELLQEKINQISRGFNSDIEIKILDAKSELDSLVSQSHVKFTNKVESLHNEMQNKYEGLKENIVLIDKDFRAKEEEFITRFNDFIELSKNKNQEELELLVSSKKLILGM